MKLVGGTHLQLTQPEMKSLGIVSNPQFRLGDTPYLRKVINRVLAPTVAADFAAFEARRYRAESMEFAFDVFDYVGSNIGSEPAIKHLANMMYFMTIVEDVYHTEGL